MRPQDYAINLVLSVILIVGTYQFYFFTQRFQLARVRSFNTRVDDLIPFQPAWVWIYSFLYYPAILYLNLIAQNQRHFVLMAFSFMVLLFMQMACFMLFPVSTPEHWRKFDGEQGLSARFLKFVHKFDASTNCFPSMHVSVATLTALHAIQYLGPWSYLFPLAIGVSCLFTKQHYLVDLPFGAVLGWLAYAAYEALV